MTITVKDTGFTKNLDDKIKALGEAVKKLSSDNFEKISPALIDLDRKLESINFMYGGMSMINSVDSYKIDAMIRHLKLGAKEFLLVEKANMVDPYTQADGSRDVEVPAGYSGFNSIVLPFGLMSVPYSVKAKDKNDSTMVWYTKNDRTIKFEWKNIMQQFKSSYPMINPKERNFVSVLFWR
jgi:hypothetical protein